MVRIFRGGVRLPAELEGTVIIIGPEACLCESLIAGDLYVRNGGKVELLGDVSGNLYVERSAEITVRGTVGRNAKASGGVLNVYGTVNGDVIDAGGEVYVDDEATVRGRVREDSPP